MSRGTSQHLRQIHQQQQNVTQKQKQQQVWAQQHAWHARGQQPKTHSRDVTCSNVTWLVFMSHDSLVSALAVVRSMFAYTQEKESSSFTIDVIHVYVTWLTSTWQDSLVSALAVDGTVVKTMFCSRLLLYLYILCSIHYSVSFTTISIL